MANKDKQNVKRFIEDISEEVADTSYNKNEMNVKTLKTEEIQFKDGSSMSTAPHLYEYTFSADCNDQKEWYFRLLSTENVNNLSNLLDLIDNNSKIISIIGENETHEVKPINSIYYNGEQHTEMLIDELYDNEQNIGFLVADANYQSKKQLF